MLLTGFEGRTVVVTGAAGGIGTAICHTLAAAGARLMAVDRDPEALDRLVRSIPSATVAGAAVDVTEDGTAEDVLDRAELRLGPVSGLVNAAGVLRAGSALTCPDDDWDTLLRVNATGVFAWTRAAARRWWDRIRELVVTMPYPRQHFASLLRRTGFPEIADEALRILPDPVDKDQIPAFLAPYAISTDELVNRMGAEI